jgi:hypothetical protein
VRISRRAFACGVAGIVAAVDAFETPVINEWRVYAVSSAVPPLEILSRNGILPVSVKPTQDGTAYLFAFESLEARVKAWDRFNADQGWCAIRDARDVEIMEISVYPGGKIFEMSL